jgi:hypothetical protein
MKKKTMLSIAAILSATLCFAQPNPAPATSKFEQAILKNLAVLDTATSPGTFMMLANSFDRIAQAEKKEWVPFYYTAYVYTIMAMNVPDNAQKDVLADKAEGYLKKAGELSANNSEISCLHAMIVSARILVDPMNRWLALSPEASSYLATAKAQDPTNPRPLLLEANTKLRMPEALGGGKQAAKPLVEDAIKKFESFKPASSVAPNWGKKQALRLLQAVN